MNNNQPTPAEVARQLEEARVEIERVTKLENINRNVAAQSLAKVQELKAEIERLRAELSAKAKPLPYYAVYVQGQINKEPVAVFGYQDQAVKWASKTYSGYRVEVFGLVVQAPGEKGGEG